MVLLILKPYYDLELLLNPDRMHIEVKMMRAHKIRFFPNEKQKILLRKSCGVARFAYNWALAEWKQAYENKERINELKLRKKLNQIKRDQFPWMMEVTKCAPEQAIKDLGLAFSNFLKKIAFPFIMFNKMCSFWL